MRFVKHQSKQQLQTCSGCAEGLESVSKGIYFAIIKLFVKFFDEIMVFDAGRALIASFLKVDDKVKDIKVEPDDSNFSRRVIYLILEREEYNFNFNFLR